MCSCTRMKRFTSRCAKSLGIVDPYKSLPGYYPCHRIHFGRLTSSTYTQICFSAKWATDEKNAAVTAYTLEMNKSHRILEIIYKSLLRGRRKGIPFQGLQTYANIGCPVASYGAAPLVTHKFRLQESLALRYHSWVLITCSVRYGSSDLEECN